MKKYIFIVNNIPCKVVKKGGGEHPKTESSARLGCTKKTTIENWALELLRCCWFVVFETIPPCSCRRNTKKWADNKRTTEKKPVRPFLLLLLLVGSGSLMWELSVGKASGREISSFLSAWDSGRNFCNKSSISAKKSSILTKHYIYDIFE